MLSIKDLSVGASGKNILNGISCAFESGKTYAIMGPNGSGKSTLVQTVMGNPVYAVSKESSLIFDKKKLNSLPTDKRARLGIGITFQSPLSLQGISVFQLLRLAMKNVDVLKLHVRIEALAKELKIKKELIDRPLNENASGGERKKLEVLQMAILNPSLIFFDEIDTGVDIDSLKIIFSFLKKIKKDKTFVFITHHNKIFSYIEPDEVLVMKNGEIVKIGDKKLVQKIEENGYEDM